MFDSVLNFPRLKGVIHHVGGFRSRSFIKGIWSKNLSLLVMAWFIFQLVARPSHFFIRNAAFDKTMVTILWKLPVFKPSVRSAMSKYPLAEERICQKNEENGQFLVFYSLRVDLLSRICIPFLNEIHYLCKELDKFDWWAACLSVVWITVFMFISGRDVFVCQASAPSLWSAECWDECWDGCLDSSERVRALNQVWW